MLPPSCLINIPLRLRPVGLRIQVDHLRDPMLITIFDGASPFPDIPILQLHNLETLSRPLVSEHPGTGVELDDLPNVGHRLVTPVRVVGSDRIQELLFGLQPEAVKVIIVGRVPNNPPLLLFSPLPHKRLSGHESGLEPEDPGATQGQILTIGRVPDPVLVWGDEIRGRFHNSRLNLENRDY